MNTTTTGPLAPIVTSLLLGPPDGTAPSPNAPDPTPMPTDRDDAPPADLLFAPLDGVRIAYASRGAGERALVLVHGASADHSHWTHQLEGLRTDRRLLAIDLIGHGASDAPPEHAAPGDPYSMALYARSVAAVLDHAGVERAVLVGHSNGVPVVREVLRLFPARVEALVAVDGAFRQAISKEVFDWMQAALARPDYREFMRSMSALTPRGGLSDEDFERVKRTADVPREVMAGWLAAMQGEDVWREDAIPVPLLVVRAARGPHDTPETDAVLSRIAPHAEVVTLADVGHFVMMERAREFDELLGAFVDALPDAHSSPSK